MTEFRVFEKWRDDAGLKEVYTIEAQNGLEKFKFDIRFTIRDDIEWGNTFINDLMRILNEDTQTKEEKEILSLIANLKKEFDFESDALISDLLRIVINNVYNKGD